MRQSTDGSSKYNDKSSKEQGITTTLLDMPDTIEENDANAKFGRTSAQHRRLASKGWADWG